MTEVPKEQFEECTIVFSRRGDYVLERSTRNIYFMVIDALGQSQRVRKDGLDSTSLTISS